MVVRRGGRRRREGARRDASGRYARFALQRPPPRAQRAHGGLVEQEGECRLGHDA